MRDIKNFLANASPYPGVYQMLGENGEVIYVGKAKNLKKRLSSYFSNHIQDQKTLTLVKQIKDIHFTVTSSENEAVLLECNLIKQHRPRYNILLRDDKSYPYILISDHAFPRIDIYRGTRRKNGRYFGPFVNASTVRETISLLQKIFRLRTCRDSFFAARTRPCLLYQIGRCTAPCVNLISEPDYAQNVELAIKFLEGKSDEVFDILQKNMETASSQLHFETAAGYRDQINRLRQIQDKQYVTTAEGNADVVGYALQAGVVCIQLLTIRDGQVLGSRSYFPTIPKHSSKDEIISAFLSQHYLGHQSHVETIPKHIVVDEVLTDRELLENVLSDMAKRQVVMIVPTRGDKKKWLEMAFNTANQSLSAHLVTKSNLQARILELQNVFSLKALPRRIECFDISHSMGEATVASCVVFDQNGPVKSAYRRFNITNITPGDDVAAMGQVLLRRFKRLQKDDAVMPDIVLIDGGPTQLAKAAMVLTQLEVSGILLVGVSKGPDRKAGFESLHLINQPPMHLPADSLALHFIQQIRDEAHRFAITGHRQRRDKARRQSTLENIAGIGAKKRRELLRYFGGIQGVAHASLDELTKVPGISLSLAERIFAALHDATI